MHKHRETNTRVSPPGFHIALYLWPSYSVNDCIVNECGYTENNLTFSGIWEDICLICLSAYTHNTDQKFRVSKIFLMLLK